MWPFRNRPKMLMAARPHPSHLLRIKPNKEMPKDHASAIPKMVIFVRSDLHMSTSKIATHAVYAAFALYQQVCERANACSRWKNTGEKKAVTRVAGEAQLDALLDAARAYKLPAAIIRDSKGQSSGKGGPKTAVSILGPSHILNSLVINAKRAPMGKKNSQKIK